MKRLIPVILVVILDGCATRPPACPVEDLAAAAIHAEQSRAELSSAHPECPAPELEMAYTAALASRCTPQRAWSDGIEGRETLGLCREQGGRLWLEAYNLGLRQREFSAELTRIEAQIAALQESEEEADQAAARRAGLTRIRLIRELDSIRGAAKIRGWSD